MIKKRMTAMALSVLLILTLGACRKGGDEYSYYSEIVLEQGDATGNKNSATQSGTSTGKTSEVVPGVSDGIVNNTYENSIKPDVKGFAANYEIKHGTKAVDAELDFKGKTFTMATGGGCTSTYLRTVKDFENQYNCKIKITDLNYGTYITQIAAAVAADNAFDICGMQGEHFPTEAVKGLIEPLENAITTADLYDPQNPSLHSIDFNYSQLTSWGNHMYGVCGHGASVSQPNIFYYNKRLFKENGLKDPYELYQSGNWTWDEIKQMGRQVSNSAAGINFLDGDCVDAVPYSNACEWINYSEDGKITENLTAARNVNALKLLSELLSGNNPVMGKRAFTDNTTNFFSGKSFVFYQSYVYGQQFIRPAIQDGTATAFNKDVNNMGIVPVPAGPDNTDGTYQAGTLDFITCGKGKDPIAAIVWAKFKSSYNSSSKTDKNSYTSDEWKLIESLANGKVYVSRIYGFSTTTTSASEIIYGITASVADGADISSALENNRSQVQSCIDTTLKLQ